MLEKKAGDAYPKFKAAAVQMAPVFLDREATIDKIDGKVAEAKVAGADLVVFGETIIPAYPVWNMLYPPIDQHGFYKRMFQNAVEIPGPALNRIGMIARRHGVFLSIGVTEKGPVSMGAMWNTNLLFDREGRLLNRHQKLVPTWAEKLTWARGDGSSLRVVRTELGRIGVLNCGENTNPLARFALLAQGEQVHIATYPTAFPFKRLGSAGNYNLTEAIRIRSAAHSFEGKVFNIVASGVLDEDAIEQVSMGNEEIRAFLENTPKPATMILGPTGELITDPLIGKEGMIMAEIDVSQSIEQKEIHDVVGYYNRFDVFRLELNVSQNLPIRIIGEEEPRPEDLLQPSYEEPKEVPN